MELTWSKKECIKLIDEGDRWWSIGINQENFYVSELGLFENLNVLFARILNISFNDYIKFCNEVFKAEIYGNDPFSIKILFRRSPELVQFVRLLNNCANLIVWERENPDWKKHQEALRDNK